MCTESSEAARYVGVVTPQSCPVDEGLIDRAGVVSVGGLSDCVFSVAFPPLSEQYARDPSRIWPRVALSHVLAGAPAAMLEANAAKCVPMALAVLDCVSAAIDEAASMAGLAMIASIVTTVPSLLGDHVGDIAAKLAAVATSAKQPARARAAALETLLAIRQKVPEYRTLPHQTAIVQLLQPTLDDPKRAVRSVAVRCKNAWTIFQ
jgi:DNA repair/transcription protein MET18/MMS19